MATSDQHDERFEFTDGKHTHTVAIGGDDLVTVTTDGTSMEFPLDRLQHFYVASNGRKAQLTLVAGPAPRRVLRLGSGATQPGLVDVVLALRARMPEADRCGLRLGKALSTMRVVNFHFWIFVLLPLVAVVVAAVFNHERLAVAFGHSNATFDLNNLPPNWRGKGNRITFRNGRVLLDHALWEKKGRTARTRYYAPLVAQNWAPTQPVSILVVTTTRGELENLAGQTTIRGIVRDTAEHNIDYNTAQRIREGILLVSESTALQVPIPPREGLLYDALLLLVLAFLGAAGVSVFLYRRWSTRDSYPPAELVPS